MTKKILMSWSAGKDSAFALNDLLKSGSYEIVSLLTTVTEGYDRISMHGVRTELLESQADSLNLPLTKIWIPKDASNEEYEERMIRALLDFKRRGVHTVAFADLFLEEVKTYRENLLQRVDMMGLFPVWKRNTREFFDTFLQLGFRAITVCVDSRALDRDFVGRELDQRFLDALPAHVDPCGENGEFHTFVFEGPCLKKNVRFRKGEVVTRGHFHFCDLLPESVAVATGR